MKFSLVPANNLGKVELQERSWSKIVEVLSKRTEVECTMEELLAMTPSEQTKVKNIGGITSACFKGNKRLAADVTYSEMLILDLDGAAKTPYEIVSEIENFDADALIYSTIKHTDEKPRLRVIFPLANPVNRNQYRALANALMEKMVHLGEWDKTCNEAERLMFKSTTTKGGDHFAIHIEGFTYIEPSEFVENINDISSDMPQISVMDAPDDDFEFMLQNMVGTLPEADMRNYLSKLNNNVKNDEWVKVGQALHEWSPVKGLALWDEWSKGGDTYQEGECEKRWKSFKQGGGVGVGTLVHMAKVEDVKTGMDSYNTLRTMIENASETEIQLTIPKEVAKADLGELHVDSLVKITQTRLHELLGTKPAVGAVRSLFKTAKQLNKNSLEGELVDPNEIPRWCKDWVYSIADSCYIRISKRSSEGGRFNAEAFNLTNGKFIPFTNEDETTKVNATKYVSDRGFITTVASTQYLPQRHEVMPYISSLGGNDLDARVLNTFNHDTIPPSAEAFTACGLEAIERVNTHLNLLAGLNQRSQEILTYWIAHNVQFMGKKILWCPLIQSVEGVGKSWLASLMEVMLGKSNINTVTPEEIGSSFNGFARGNLVNVLNEIKISGHNRHEILNGLKSLLTDPVVSVNEKFVKPYNTLNVTNYIAFTNYVDAVPIESKADRRWFVSFVKGSTIEEAISKVTSESKDDYLEALWRMLDECGSELRKYFLELEIPKWFMNLKQAPDSADKDLLIATESENTPFLTEFREAIQKGGELITSKALCSSTLRTQVVNDVIMSGGDGDAVPKTSKLAFLLKKLGYKRHVNRLYIGGNTRTIWVRDAMSDEDIKACFEKPSLVESEW